MSSPISVLLPTVEPTAACEEVADQLGPADELLIVHDAESDPVSNHADELPGRTRVVRAGEPEGCSGKANAIAAGMEAARHDRLVWTDDDFHHPSDWLAGLRADYERHGPTSEVPVFVGCDPLAVLFEPIYVLNGTLGVSLADIPWGGSVIFDRGDIDEDAFLADLRRTVSDDGLLMEYVEMTTVKRTRRVAIGGSLRETIENQVRFTQIVRHHQPGGVVGQAVTGIAVLLGCVLSPALTAAILTLAVGGIYAAFGVCRPTYLLAFPAVVLSVLFTPYTWSRRSFVWDGRRYRWHSKFDVTVVD